MQVSTKGNFMFVCDLHATNKKIAPKVLPSDALSNLKMSISKLESNKSQFVYKCNISAYVT